MSHCAKNSRIANYRNCRVRDLIASFLGIVNVTVTILRPNVHPLTQWNAIHAEYAYTRT